ncbi:MAG: SocA family protein [Chitinophagaceae bacterium]|nr:SocA family protein [Chitinophagaceae bacterium]
MQPTFHYEQEKAIAALMYICDYLGGEWDKYSLLKILYFAEQKHLAKYGRPISGDYIVAMKHGPVPSNSYNLVKPQYANPNFTEDEENIIKINGKPDLDALSESDIECLIESINENRNYGFWRLRAKSHDNAYNNTVETKGLDATIPFIDIAISGGAQPSMVEYIKHNLELQNCSFNGAPSW